MQCCLNWTAGVQCAAGQCGAGAFGLQGWLEAAGLLKEVRVRGHVCTASYMGGHAKMQCAPSIQLWIIASSDCPVALQASGCVSGCSKPI